MSVEACLPWAPIVPTDYAFAIWSIIYLGALASAIVGVVPRYVTAITYAGSTVWLVFARFGPNWLTAAAGSGPRAARRDRAASAQKPNV